MSKYINSFPNTLISVNGKPVLSPAVRTMIVEAVVNHVVNSAPPLSAMPDRAVIAAKSAMYVEQALTRLEADELDSFLKHLKGDRS